MYGRARIAWAALLMCFAGSARAVMTISRSSVPDWTVSIAYSQALTGSDCTLGLCTWSVSGNIPPGLMLASGLVSGSAVISGTPTTTGTYTFTVTAAVAALLDSGSQSYTVTINPAPSITTGTLHAGTVGAAYSQPMTGSGGTAARRPEAVLRQPTCHRRVDASFREFRQDRWPKKLSACRSPRKMASRSPARHRTTIINCMRGCSSTSSITRELDGAI